MRTDFQERIVLPDGVTATYEARTLSVTGEKGALRRVLFHPTITVAVADGAITFVAERATLREKKRLFTFKAHAQNMVKGVTAGFTYTLKVCSGHFPMSVVVKNGRFEVKNFIGEKVPRILAIKEGADVVVEGEHVTVTGIDKEIVGQVAADIEQLTRRVGFDSRIFQDGIFITGKDGKQV